jgi:prevent-host-death family protein
VPQIPQRELRNHVSTILRRAEHGERFTVTVDGRPVAELGPIATRQRPAAPSRLAALFADTPVDEGWATDVRKMRDEDAAAARDPWVD